jgi:hypothetical protein
MTILPVWEWAGDRASLERACTVGQRHPEKAQYYRGKFPTGVIALAIS